ncbi:MAG: outer membrane protein transport protein [Culturomica sp.]|jgi:hypothetical protein|nr:outer membrane protein transport protein [Culturomica sp.]
MKKLFVLPALLLMGGVLQAQNYQDVLRYSRYSVEGTARSAAMGGAFGALGGDLSTLSTNPAGIGVFRKSEINFTSLLDVSHIKSGGTSGSAIMYYIGNLGIVYSPYTPDSDWKGVNFGFNYTNLSPYKHSLKQFVGNESSDYSLTSIWAYQAGDSESEDLDPYTTGPAYDAFLINRDSSGFYNPIFWEGPVERINQQKNIREEGYMGECAMTIGTNYKDELYLGVTIGLQRTFHELKSSYSEIGEANAPSGFDWFDYYEYQRIEGNGVNLKFGAIYRPIPQLRLGASIHTPTWYNMTFEYESGIDAHFNTTDVNLGRDRTSYSTLSPLEPYDFKMRTPWRAILSIAGVLGRKAIISMDYEYVDYPSARFTDNSFGDSYRYENDAIKATYTGGHNVRFGAEYRVNSAFSLRGGYSLQHSPYKEKGFSFTYDIPKGDKLQTVSGGFGLNFGNYYVDAAYTYRFSKDKTVFYSNDGWFLNEFNEVTNELIQAKDIANKYNEHQARLTFGLRF